MGEVGVHVQPVLMAGGRGHRLWPVSRAQAPKPFVSLSGKKTPYQQTLLRIAHGRGQFQQSSSIDVHSPWLMVHPSLFDLASRQVRTCGLEPETMTLFGIGHKGTGLVAALAAQQLILDQPETLMLLLPTDHEIPDHQKFFEAVERASSSAKAGQMVLFGAVPSFANPTYGYIQHDALSPPNQLAAVRSFIEKPEVERATQLLADGDCLWNAGIFLVRADRYLQLLENVDPDYLQSIEQLHRQIKEVSPRRWIAEPEAIDALPVRSIDRQVCERVVDEMAVVPLDTPWTDLGTFHSLWNFFADSDGENVVSTAGQVGKVNEGLVDQAETRIVQSSGNYIHRHVAGRPKPLVLNHLVGHYVVETKEVLMVGKLDAQALQDRQVVDNEAWLTNRLEKQPTAPGNAANSSQELSSPEEAGDPESESQVGEVVNKDWGWYQIIHCGAGYQVKRIFIGSGEALSLQYHLHRSENWTVVQGTPLLTKGEERIQAMPGTCLHIPPEVRHRIENDASEPCLLIEVQVGDYLGEDDIVRIEDRYGRI